MWMDDGVVHEIVVRQQIRDAREAAARQFALANAKGAQRAQRRPGRLTQLVHALADLHPKQFIARMVKPAHRADGRLR
jgi:hypothetical protein